MRQSSRRDFIKGSAASVAAVASMQALGQSPAQACTGTVELQAAAARQLQATTSGWNDSLAHPIPYKSAPGQGKDRAIGHAAMVAKSISSEKFETNIKVFLGDRTNLGERSRLHGLKHRFNRNTLRYCGRLKESAGGCLSRHD